MGDARNTDCVLWCCLCICVCGCGPNLSCVRRTVATKSIVFAIEPTTTINMSGDTAALTFKAGRVEYDETTKQATPLAGSGQVIVQRKPDDPMFCSLTWERRATKGKPLGTSTPEEEFEELLLFPGDAEWNHVKECTTGRVFELKFKSSGQRHVFWMQAPTSDSNLSTLSNEDKTIAEQMKQFLEEEAAAEDEEMDDADSETAPTR